MRGSGPSRSICCLAGVADKPALLRPYLQRWKWEAGRFPDRVGPDSTEEEFFAIAPRGLVAQTDTS